MTRAWRSPRRGAPPLSAQHTDTALVLPLDDERAGDRDLTGGKAAALAVATHAGHQTVPGFVLTTAGAARIDEGDSDAVHDALVDAWRELSDDGRHPVVVRSSSVVEDAGDESMAGRYETEADVADEEELLGALDAVLASRAAVAEHADIPHDHAIAVLVQRQLTPAWGGVAFGVDPVSGRPDRRVVVAGEGAPEELVAGSEQGEQWTTDPSGSVIEEPEDRSLEMPEELVARIVELVGQVNELFDDPQDVEWAADRDGTIWLLQTRPVTTTVTGVPTGPILGTGPIAETFPDRLTALERDLWLPPLREAIAKALEVAAIASQDDIDASPVVTDIDGRPAVDLELFGRVERNSSPIRDRARKIAASWRLGRLRRALPRIAQRIIGQADEALADVNELGDYETTQLLDLLDNSHDALRSLHGHEVLMGLLTESSDSLVTGTGIGLRALAAARRDGLDDRAAIARDPAILALFQPGIGRQASLPPTDDLPALRDGSPPPDDPGVLREALRMRVRWVQELTARASEELGRRLAADGLLDDAADVAHVAREQLWHAVETGTAPRIDPEPEAGPLPNRFRLTQDGTPVPEGDAGNEGVAAGGGSAEGPVQRHRTGDAVEDIEEGVVLVTEELSPDLAAVLPRVRALVATTGSPLSHVAILARESGTPAVVGLAKAMERFEDGQQVQVDGDAGDIEVVEGTP